MNFINTQEIVTLDMRNHPPPPTQKEKLSLYSFLSHMHIGFFSFLTLCYVNPSLTNSS